MNDKLNNNYDLAHGDSVAIAAVPKLRASSKSTCVDNSLLRTASGLVLMTLERFRTDMHSTNTFACALLMRKKNRDVAILSVAVQGV